MTSNFQTSQSERAYHEQKTCISLTVFLLLQINKLLKSERETYHEQTCISLTVYLCRQQTSKVREPHHLIENLHILCGLLCRQQTSKN
jgi:hypothetical protein